MLKPKLIDTLHDYSLTQFRGDLIAGIVVGIVALPLALAFAIASGVTPEKGLITAVIAGFIISALGGSSVQIGGPTGAFVVIVYGIVHEYGIQGLTIATIMAGLFLVLFGLIRLGSVIKLIPYPVIIGFTSGIAVIIFSSQINDLLGLGLTNIPVEFLDKWHLYLSSLSNINLPSAALAAATIAIILGFSKWNRSIPGSFIAIVLTTLAACLLKMPVETIGDRFGEIGGASFAFEVPKFSFEAVTGLIRPALTIAILAAIESLLSAVVADGMTGGKHRSNMELIAQGVANIVTPLFGGIPATGAIARTATNIHNGGRTPVAGIIHAAVLFCLLFFFGKYASLIPFATLAGILAVISYRMAECHSFIQLLKSPKCDVAVLLSVFLLTVIFDLTIAIEFGLVLAAMLLIKRLAEADVVNEIQGVYIDEEERDDPDA
ncbi:MAG: SulP family inorganic anion transporter, partial [Phycisphaerae bacterium]